MNLGSVLIFQLIANAFIAGACLLAAVTIFKNWKNNKMVYFFGLFWLAHFFLWLSNALGGSLWRLEIFPVFSTVYFFYVVFSFAFLGTPFLIYYLVLKSSNKEFLAKIFFIIYIFLVAIGAFFLFKTGMSPRITELGVKWPMPHYAFLTLQIIYAGVIFFAMFDFFKRIIQWISQGRLTEWHLLVSTIALIFYAVGTYFDAQGAIDVLKILLFKLLILAGVLLVYIAYSLGAEKKSETVYEI